MWGAEIGKGHIFYRLHRVCPSVCLSGLLAERFDRPEMVRQVIFFQSSAEPTRTKLWKACVRKIDSRWAANIVNNNATLYFF